MEDSSQLINSQKDYGSSSSTSPGQLGKYVIATVESINSAKVSTATKTYTLKKSTQNTDAVKQFLELGMGGSSTQKEALNIMLLTTDSKTKQIKIGSLNKPNIKYNLGAYGGGCCWCCHLC